MSYMWNNNLELMINYKFLTFLWKIFLHVNMPILYKDIYGYGEDLI